MIDERLFKPATIEQAKELYEALIQAGTSYAVARGLLGWILVLPERRSEDPAGNQVRRDYRRELLRLGKPPWGLPAGGKGAYTQWANAA